MSQIRRLSLASILMLTTMSVSLPMQALSHLTDDEYVDQTTTIVYPRSGKETFYAVEYDDTYANPLNAIEDASNTIEEGASSVSLDALESVDNDSLKPITEPDADLGGFADVNKDSGEDPCGVTEESRDISAKEEDFSPTPRALEVADQNTSDDDDKVTCPKTPKEIKEFIYADDGKTIEGYVVEDSNGNQNELFLVTQEEFTELEKDDIEMYAYEIIQIDGVLYQRVYVKQHPLQQLLIKIADDSWGSEHINLDPEEADGAIILETEEVIIEDSSV